MGSGGSLYLRWLSWPAGAGADRKNLVVCVATLGLVFASVYSLIMMQRACFGPSKSDSPLRALGRREFSMMLVLEKNPKNAGLLNALIVYQSKYLNAPMQFLGTLKTALATDSSNIETHYIHLNLLKKSQQWPKALKNAKN